jgi:enoyl-CoA hydratase
MDASQDVLFEEISGRDGNIGLITLNRPKVLNALNHKMFNIINYHLAEWETADNIKAVIIRAAEGRAFCAGGDIRSAYEKKLNNDQTLIYFFRDEYQMNLRIYHYPKPFIALLDGITMGGGAGISINGSHRVATERLVFAMPETGIGFYPDVGGTYFLSRLPYKMGFYLGLTGVRINYNDCAALGLVQHTISQESFSELTYALADTALNENAKAQVSEIIEKFAVSYPKSELLEHLHEIESCFSKNTVEEIFQALEKNGNEWCLQTLTSLKTKSPTSLKVTLNALQEGEKNSFNSCMRTEYRLTTRFLEAQDFFEGIRAAIIDKDQTPHWMPATLADVSTEEVKKYFAPLHQELV